MIPRTFTAVRTTTVRRKGGPTDQLNELEFSRAAGRDVVWANRWQSNEILRIERDLGSRARFEGAGILAGRTHPGSGS